MIVSKVKNSPTLPNLKRIKDKILGSKYELSVVFVGETKIRSLNKIYRNKDQATDILSFPLSKESGEIFINLEQTRKKSKSFKVGFKNFLIYLVIHGLVHLKGLDHGDTMDKTEKKFCKYFKLPWPHEPQQG